MNPWLVGLSYRTASVGLREQLTIPLRDIPEALSSLCAAFDMREAVILSTCNRVELYVVPAFPDAADTLIDFLSHRSRLAQAAFQPHLYTLTGRAAVAHLFTVTAGLDSMILGESEIAAQVKQAYLAAQAQGTAGPTLNRLFQKALHAAKEVRSRTGIGQGQASVGSVVAGLSRTLFGDRLAACEALLWGAGKAAESTARHLIKSGLRRLWIVNRTQLKARDLASICQSGWLSWEQARAHLAHVDIAIVCTQAPHYVIDAGDLAELLPSRNGRPLCLIDLAVPRNVDPSLRAQPGITLYDIDDLQDIASQGRERREQARAQGTALIEQQVAHLFPDAARACHEALA